MMEDVIVITVGILWSAHWIIGAILQDRETQLHEKNEMNPGEEEHRHNTGKERLPEGTRMLTPITQADPKRDRLSRCKRRVSVLH